MPRHEGYRDGWDDEGSRQASSDCGGASAPVLPESAVNSRLIVTENCYFVGELLLCLEFL